MIGLNSVSEKSFLFNLISKNAYYIKIEQYIKFLKMNIRLKTFLWNLLQSEPTHQNASQGMRIDHLSTLLCVLYLCTNDMIVSCTHRCVPLSLYVTPVWSFFFCLMVVVWFSPQLLPPILPVHSPPRSVQLPHFKTSLSRIANDAGSY